MDDEQSGTLTFGQSECLLDLYVEDLVPLDEAGGRDHPVLVRGRH